jgi:hypothetical protein
VSTPKNPYAALEDMLQRTREQELDCDEFVNLLAPYVDDRVQDPVIIKLIEHHRDLCAECAEQLRFLQVSLDGRD